MKTRRRLWKHQGSAIAAEGTAESNLSFLIALQTSRVHPWFNIRMLGMNQIFKVLVKSVGQYEEEF